MEAVLSRLQTLSPDQLREEIRKAGLKYGPITATTRGIFEKRLARTLLESQEDGGRSEVDSSTCSLQDTHSPKAAAEGKTLDGEDLSPSTPPVEDVSQQVSPESPSIFYGVLPPMDDPFLHNGSLYVYVDKQKALRAVMKMKGSRFKAFSSREDAEDFAKGICDGGLSPSRLSAEKSHTVSPAAEKSMNLQMANMEKANEFKSPRPQDLTAKLRRAVENGDEEAFKELVWNNPRYLIGSGDNPTIVQEGCRYNVLHIAAKENQPGMAYLILETLESPEFMRLMYPDDQEDMLWQRIDYIVDLYLNTPDKGSNDTPLHFACKFGCPEVVNVLCLHPATDKNSRNKYGQKPSSVICERKNKTKEIKEKIKEYLDDRFIVPLLRATDNTLNPVIGMPRAPGFSECGNPSLIPGVVEDPKNPVMTIRAFAGPLNPSKAEEFHKLWKTPPRSRARYFHDILKSDPDRGAERVGREFAHEMGHPWAEYWDFLNCFTDLSTDDGLSALEDYLNKIVHQKNTTNKRWIHISSSASSSGCDQEPSTTSGAFVDHLHSLSGSSHDCWTDENSPRASHKQSPVCDLLQEFERVSFDQASEEENTVDSGLGSLVGSRGDCLADRGWEWTGEDDDSSAEEYYTADEGDDAVRRENRSEARGILARKIPLSCGEQDLSSCGSSCSSYKSTHSTPEHTGTAERVWQNIFLAGESPSKLDNDVLVAVTGADTDLQLYPCITKWKNTVLSYPESQRQRWPNVTMMNSHPESQMLTPRRLTRSWLTGSPRFLNMKFIPGSYKRNSSTPSKPATSRVEAGAHPAVSVSPLLLLLGGTARDAAYVTQ